MLVNKLKGENDMSNSVVILKSAVVDVKTVVETSASKLKDSSMVSLLDACTCTGNCC